MKLAVLMAAVEPGRFCAAPGTSSSIVSVSKRALVWTMTSSWCRSPPTAKIEPPTPALTKVASLTRRFPPASRVTVPATSSPRRVISILLSVGSSGAASSSPSIMSCRCSGRASIRSGADSTSSPFT
ncbi:hypothetical protein D9M68_898740 [compost metagenome]